MGKQVTTSEEVWEAWVCPGGRGSRCRESTSAEGGGGRPLGKRGRVQESEEWAGAWVYCVSGSSLGPEGLRRGEAGGQKLEFLSAFGDLKPSSVSSPSGVCLCLGVCPAAGPGLGVGRLHGMETVELGRADSGFEVQEIPGLGREASRRADRRVGCFYTRESAAWEGAWPLLPTPDISVSNTGIGFLSLGACY